MITNNPQAGEIFVSNPLDFSRVAADIFQKQSAFPGIYQQYLHAIGAAGIKPESLCDIPFLPISFFKTHTVRTGDYEPAFVFESSRTTGLVSSRHLVRDLSVYRESFTRGFRHFYGPVEAYCIIGLLPSYLERNQSSLVYMVEEMINNSNHPMSGFYLYDHEKLAATLTVLEAQKQKTILIGVGFALLDFSEKFPIPLRHTLVMETGGMKGRRKEMTRIELHEILKARFSTEHIHSEYGMTELLSQAYAQGDGLLKPVPWMKVLVREEDDPFCVREQGTGILNVIDLANAHSCAFIATEDVGRLYPDGSFEVSGRVDNSDLRGCSLLVV